MLTKAYRLPAIPGLSSRAGIPGEAARHAIEREAPLVSRFRSGDESALEEIVTLHKRPLFRFIYRHVNDRFEAEDILSQTFINAWRNRSRFRPRAQLQTWLFTIAGNLCRDHARKRKRHPADFAARWSEFDEERDAARGRTLSGAGDPAGRVAGIEEMDVLRQAIDDLPHDLKNALILFSLEGRSQTEVGRLLGCSPKAVETRIYRARQILRSKLERIVGQAP